MASKKIQLYTDRDKTIEASPETSANCVILSDGNDLQKVLDNDLTTPTVVHEETSFKVGVGDVNVSSSVVDGEVGRMVIKGKTYQNILPEPSLRNSMTNGKSMQKLNEGYENVNVVDGVAKSAILKGQTLVNICKPFEFDIQTTGSGLRHLKDNYNMLNIPLDDNKKYSVWVEVDINEIGAFSLSHTGGVASLVFDPITDLTLTGGSVVVYPCAKRRNSNNTCFTIGAMPGSTEGRLKGRVMVFEGDVRGLELSYFEGMQSVRMPVLTTTGKNLCGRMESGSLTQTEGMPGEHPGRIRTVDYIKIDSSYWVSTETSAVLGLRYYDNNKKCIGYPTITMSANTPVNITNIPSGSKYLKFTVVDITDVNYKIYLTKEKHTTGEYEPFKSNILSTPSDLVLGKVGDVEDTLNLLTGEVVEQTEELELNVTSVVFDSVNNNNLDRFVVTSSTLPKSEQSINSNAISNNGMIAESNFNYGSDNTFSYSNSTKKFYFTFTKDTVTSEELLNKLTTNKMIIRFKKITPVVKTVDLSAYGNWRKIVLDGVSRVDWVHDPEFNRYYLPFSNLLKAHDYTGLIFCDNEKYTITPSHLTVQDYDYAISGYRETHTQYNENWLYIAIKECTSKQMLLDYLSQNPITVWYQTATSQDNSITEMLSFSNGHIQLSSEEGSLIPSLDYEVPTSNSYHMDLLKNNVIYTMKCENPNGKLLVKDADITLRENRTIQIGLQYMPDDNLFINTGSWTNPMIIEGDLTSKTLPYFKGIKSSFENEDKIEVLSTGKNLFDGNILGGYIGSSDFKLYDDNGVYKSIKIYLKKGTYTLSSTKPVNIIRLVKDGVYEPISDKFNIKTHTVTLNTDCYFGVSMRDSTSVNTIWEGIDIQIERSLTNSPHEPHKSNNTKIPLLSPLRSLPDGTCDELIIDRMKKKATLIQRVGHTILGQGDGWGSYDNVGDTMKVGRSILPHVKIRGEGMSTLIPYTFNSVSQPNEGVYIYRHASSSEVRVRLKLKRTGRHDVVGMQNWLRSNNIVTLYELETPIVTKINLENFPLVYKDGHIFLNSEIAPVVEINYNVNQSQQIQANNETLQRHELDILDLDNLIVSFVNAEYNLRLLKFDMELSMMALAE